MGYTSDVVLMAVFANAEQHDEVMAVYRMNFNVQEYDLEKAWRRVDLKDGEVVRIYEGNPVKWYKSFADVQGLEYMSSLLADFHEEREFDYAWGKVRIGEDTDDTVYDVFNPETDASEKLRDIVYEGLSINRRINLGF
jgi:hypothetical protein